MLQTIRTKIQGWLAVVVLAIVAVPLALTFVSSDFTIGSSNYAARVNGKDITLAEFQRVYQNRLISEQEASGTVLTAEAEEALKRNTLDQMILSRSITQFAEDAGFRVSPRQVIESIRNIEAFQVAGQFSKPAYDAALAAAGVRPVDFENSQRAQLALGQLQQGLIESSFYTPGEFRRVIALYQERRNVGYVVLDAKVLGSAASISDADIEAYYTSNSTRFQSPENVTVEYVEVVQSDMARDYTPDDQTLRAAYEADPDRFNTAEQRRARHILVAVDSSRTDAVAKALADEIAGRLAKGEDFAALAAQYSNDPGSAGRGGDLGFAAPGTYVEPFENVLFALDKGETSEPVRTEFGYHIIRLEEIRPRTGRSFEEVRGELTEELRQRKAQDEFYAIAQRVDDLALDNPTSLEPVAQDTGLTVQRYEGFTRTDGGPLGGNANLVTALFSPGVLEGSENTPLIELDESRAVVARVAEHKPAAPLPLAQVRGAIIEELRGLRGASEAVARGKAILERVKAGESLAAAAKAEGLSVEESASLARRMPGLQPDLLSAIFRARKPSGGAVVDGVALDDGSYAVFELRSVASGSPERIPAEVRDIRKRELAQVAAIREMEAVAARRR